MAVANAYNPNPSTVDSILRQRQTRVDLGRESGVIPANVPTPTPTNPKFFGVEQTPNTPDKGFIQKTIEDAALLSYAIPTGIARLGADIVGGAADAATGNFKPITKTVTDFGGALVQGVKDTVNPDYYKAHPLLGVVNLAGFVMPIAGAAKTAALKVALREALATGIKESVVLGVEEGAAKSALSVGVKEVGGFLTKKGVVGDAVWEAAKTGKVELVTEVVKNLMKTSGATDEVALRVATKVSDNLYTTFSRQTTKMKVLDGLAHPFGAAGKYIAGKTDPIRQRVFGSSAETAVAKLYGAETVAKNPEGFVAIERWADAQVKEQGLESTLANRQRVMQSWVEQNSEWASLTPEQRIAHFENYAKSDLTRKAIHEATGIDIVSVKALPQNYVDAMVETLNSAPKDLAVPDLMKLMDDTYGRDFTNHTAEIEKSLINNNTKDGIINVVSKLGDARSTISFTKFSPEVQTLASELEKSGYRIGHAPTSKDVSFATDVLGGGISKSPAKAVIADEAYATTVKNGGVTISLQGVQPNKGFAYAPFKGTEQMVSTDQVVVKTFLDFIKAHEKELAVPGNYLGSWEFEGNTYFDISRIAEPSMSALGDAIKAKQLAGFDLATKTEVPLAKLVKGVYTPLYETSNHPYLNTGENLGTGGTGSLPEFSKVPPGQGTGGISTNAALAKRTAFGNWIDKLGLSPSGTIEGAAEFSYRENFTQNALGEFAQKNKGIVRAKSINSTGTVAIPVEKLFEWLDKNKSIIRGAREKFSLPIRTVFDLKEADLIRAGFKADVAADIVSISKKSLIDIPTSVVGMGDKVINFLRTRNKGYNAWMSNVYDTYLKAAYKGRYDLSPFFSAQEFVETKLNSALFLKDPSLLAGGRSVQKVGAWTAEKLSKYIGDNTANYLNKIIEKPPLAEVVAVRDEILGTLQKTMLDYTSSPDIINIQGAANGVKGLAGEAAFEQSIKSRNLWFGLTGQSSVRMATTFNKALATKFGMTIEEALNFTMKNGTKVYKNPQMVQMMRDATQQVFHYTPGFLTSPLVKTMNIVWFPFRFEVKTVSLVSKWASSLSPVSRLVVMNNWVHFANWAGTDEGIQWRRTNRNMLYNIFSYVTAYEQMGQGIEAVSKGRFFGGNAGLVGGVPFGFVVNLARQLAILPGDTDQYDAKTGKRFMATVPKELVSAASFAVALEQLMISVSPSTPFYSLTGGVVSGVSPTKVYKSLVEQVVGAGVNLTEGRDPAKGGVDLRRDFKRVPLDYSRLTQ